jgi:hypothetical protein
MESVCSTETYDLLLSVRSNDPEYRPRHTYRRDNLNLCYDSFILITSLVVEPEDTSPLTLMPTI